MSCYEWEEGTIRLPSKEYSKFRKALVKAYNDELSYQLEKVNDLRDYILMKNKGKRNINFMDSAFHYADLFKVTDDTIHKLFRNGNVMKRPNKMTKKAMEFAKSTHVEFPAGYDGHIFFHSNSKNVTWAVGENNHSIDNARESVMGKAFFRLLRNVKWTRGSGGVIVGNNEYNRDDHCAGGGGNYVTASYNRKDEYHI